MNLNDIVQCINNLSLKYKIFVTNLMYAAKYCHSIN